MSYLRRLLMGASQGIKVGDAFCDLDGNQICTTLADGVVLYWQQWVQNPNCDSFEGFSIGGTRELVDDGIKITNTSDYNNGIAITLDDYTDEAILIRYKAYDGGGENNTEIKNTYGTNGIGGQSKVAKSISLSDELRTYGNRFVGTYTGGNTSVGLRRYTKGCIAIFNQIIVYNLTDMFADYSGLIPADYNAFNEMFYVGNDKANIGAVAYTETATKVIAKGGKLYKVLS